MRTRRSRAILSAAVVTVAALTLLSGCVRVTWHPGHGDTEVFGSADLETREFDFTGFTKVETGYAFDVDLIRADTHEVTITMNENLFDYLDASQRGELLTVRLMPGYTYRDVTCVPPSLSLTCMTSDCQALPGPTSPASRPGTP